MSEIAIELGKTAERFFLLRELVPEIERAVEVSVHSLRQNGTLFFCGNGGSASQSQHFAAELVGRYKIDRPAMSALSLTVDTSNLTAIGNDYGYPEVFSRQLDGLGRRGDVLFGLSTSGNSENVIRAFQVARKKEIHTIAMVGQKKGKMADFADILLAVPADISNSIQELHLAIGHIICGEIERAFYGKE